MVRRLVKAALREDLGSREDVTSLATIPSRHRSTARIIAKEKGVLCGIKAAAKVFRQRDRSVRLILRARDGSRVRAGQTVLKIRGFTRGILSAERVALNFLQRLSGIATLTDQFVQKSKIQNPKSKILDTRKTTPLLRALEKYAVRCGGGVNHRAGLYDMVLIKDNHLAALGGLANRQTGHAGRVCSPIREAVRRARRRWPRLKVEVECETLDQAREAAQARADMILLDNMMPSQLRRAVRIVKGRAKTEASGGVTLKTVGAIARTGVDFISVGALTHSARSLDFSLEMAGERDGETRPAQALHKSE